MFGRLGGFASRYRWFVVVAWVAAAVLLTLVAPNIEDVAVTDQRAFLPDDNPSLDAAAVVEREFPNRVSPSTAVVVVDAGEGVQVRESPAWTHLEELTTWLSSEQRPAAVDRILSPTDADEATADALVSDDGRVAFAVVSFNAVGTEEKTRTALDQISDRLEQAPSGEGTTYLTGDAAIISAYDQSTQDSLDSTTWITILLVITILLLVYRSPVSPFVPLVTISLAYLISRAVVAFMGDGVMTISAYTNIFIIVILFGAGTDYCLFLISRFREEMADCHESHCATRETVRTVGETIASSAGTVIVGLSTMALAELGLFKTTGPAVAISVAIALAAGLTLTPALLALLGDHTFWPRKARHIGEGRFWHWWSAVITGRPVVALLVTLALLLPLAVYGQGQESDFDLLGDLPPDVPAREGFQLLSDRVGAGVMQPMNVVMEDPQGFSNPAGLRRMQEVTRELGGVEHVGSVTSFTSSLDEGGTLSVAQQLQEYRDGVREGRQQLAALRLLLPAGLALSPTTQAALQEAGEGLLNLFSYLQQLGREYPETAATPEYRSAMEALGAIQAAAATGAGSAPAIGPVLDSLAQLETALSGLQQDFAGRPDALMVPGTYLAENPGLRGLKESYIGADEEAARFQVVLDVAPYSPEALGTVQTLREVVAAEGGGVVEGATAIMADLRTSSGRDMTRVIIFVLAGIFLVLLVLLRALVAPIYLILTILLSYGATLGIVRLVFDDLLGQPGLTWWVPIFMFVMLVALGMDYNIFLMGRVKEEVAKSGDRAGVRTAVARTGGIITSAGIIMAGTFAAMISAQIAGLRQIGFAVAVGVLLDTFVVRTALVPSIAVLLGRWSWWPRRVRRPGPG